VTWATRWPSAVTVVITDDALCWSMPEKDI